jgi:type I restriction enzyme S subunit
MSGLPSGWEEASLLELAGNSGLMDDGDWIESKDQNPEGDVRLIQLADIGDGHFVDKSRRFLTSERAAALRCTYLQPGDLLIARMPDPLGRACIFPDIGMPAVTAVDVCIWRPHPDGADARWLMHFVNSPEFRNLIQSQASGTTRQRVSGGNLKRMPVPGPPAPEQRRIVTKLDNLRARSSRARQELDHVPKLIERYKQAILAKALSGELTQDWRSIHGAALHNSYSASGIDGRIASELPELPSSWAWTSIDRAAMVSGGLTKNSKRSGILSKAKYLRVANVYANELRLDDIAEIGCTAAELSKTRLTEGDLLIVEGNGSLDQIGRVALWGGQISDCSHQNHIIRARPFPSTLPKYGLYWLLSPIGRTAIERVASSSSGLHTLSISKVSALPIPMCSESEQAEIVRRIDLAFAWLDKIATEHARAEHLLPKLDQAILAKAFRGELVPQDSNDEPASKLLQRIKTDVLGGASRKRK